MRGAGGTGRTVGELSEEGLLEIIQGALARADDPALWPEGSVPPGDDAAVVPAPHGAVVMSTDAMGEGTDFLLTWPAGVHTRGYDAGWKAAAQNLSDINAMGARPSALVTALTLPEGTDVAWVRGFARGVAGAITHLGAHGCRAAGGDLGTGERIQAAVTVLGDPHPRGVLRRRPPPAALARLAAEGADLVHCQAVPAAATGPTGGGAGDADGSDVEAAPGPHAGPGWAAAGLALLLSDRAELERRWHALDPADRPGPRELSHAVRAQLRPRPPLAAGPAAVDAGLLTLMDVSDGIGKDAHRMAAACAGAAGTTSFAAWSDEGWLARAAAPLRRVAALAETDGERLVLGGGEDYGVLGLAWPRTPLPDGFTRIGRLEPGEGQAPAAHRRLGARGWDHFAG